MKKRISKAIAEFAYNLRKALKDKEDCDFEVKIVVITKRKFKNSY